MRKKLSFLLVLSLMAGLLAAPVDAATVLKGKHGTDYTTGALAARLEHIFYSGIDEGVKPSLPKVGEYFSKSTAYTTSWTKGGGTNTAWTCMAYGQAAYNYLFGYRYGDEQHSKHFTQAETSKDFSYSNFQSWGVKCGAYLRINPWFGSDGHSFIILGYDTEGIITLEGNWDGNGKIDVLHRSWSEFNNKFKTGSVPWFVQPIQSVYDAVAYPSVGKDAGGSTNTTTESGTWIMYVPAGQYLPLYSSATATSQASSVYARSTSYRFKCTQKAVTDGKVCYRATFNDHGTERDFWLACTGGMYVTKLESTPAPTPTPTPVPKKCTTHTKGEFYTIDDDHPHYMYYKCAVCGTIFKTTETGRSTYCTTCNPPSPPKCTVHTRGDFVTASVGHPHEAYYRCAICGQLFVDGTKEDAGCEVCNPNTVKTDGTYYSIKNKATGKVLNVYYNRSADGTNVDIYDMDYTDSVYWKFAKSGGNYILTPKNATGSALNVYTDGTAYSGCNVCIWRKTGHSTQSWVIEKVDGGYILRSASNTGLVLTATGSKNNSNVNLKTYSAGDSYQVWTFHEK